MFSGGTPAIWPRLRKPSAYWLLPLPALALMAVFYLAPLANVFWISVSEPSLGLGNYQLLFSSPSIQRVISTTFRISLITTAISVVLAYILAYAIRSASARRRRLMLALIILPFWISVLVRAFAWVTLLGRQGVVNGLLAGMGITAHPLEMMYNEFGVDIGMVHYMVPVAALTLYSNMLGIDQRLVTAARGLGASRIQAFARIYLPMSLPGVVAAATLVFVFSTGFFVTPALLGGGKTLMAAEYISVQVTETLRWGEACMLASSLLLGILILVKMLSRLFDVRRFFGAA